MSERTFTDTEAKREQTPLTVGCVGPTGSGKTGSALELATGFQDIQGGDIGVIDSEARRSLAYADAPMFSEPNRRFKFRFLDFKAPFGPQDYLAACKHMIDRGAKHIIVDSTSHMWEGSGGVHEQHDEEVERLMKAWNTNSSDKVNFPAWAKPKRAQTEFVNWMKQQPINFIFAFRAKERLKMVNNKPVEAGWQAIGGEELIYEMTLACLLLPQCDGQPIWNRQEEKGVKALAQHFRPMFANNPRLSAAVGRSLAEWAKGAGTVAKPPATSHPNKAVHDAILKALNAATAKLTADEAKTRKAELCKKYFEVDTWPQLTELPAEKIEHCLTAMKAGEELL